MAYAPLLADTRAVPVRVNLYSDTQTKPTAPMRAAMAAAEVGDEQLGLDPTVNALTARVAALLSKEKAVFLPTGTMCNEIAILVHCRAGDEILAHETAHIIAAEGGAPWALAGARVRGLAGDRGIVSTAALEAAITHPSRYSAPQRLAVAEQTSNLGGGSIWPPAALADFARVAKAAGLATHMDGARLMNAVVATNIPATEMTAGYDSVWIDFTKGLGAPIGAVLAGSEAFIDACWVWKQRLGGALRQAGIAAAACLYALEHHVERLAEDHANAARLAAALAGLQHFSVETPQTNLVFIDCRASGRRAAEISAACRRKGLMVSTMGEWRLRACTHLDVDAAKIDEAVAILAEVLA